MASEGDAAQEFLVLASFDNRQAAEHMLASLGREFRKKARQSGTTALVVSGNKDGSLKLTQSRVLTASGLAAALIRVSVSWTVGLMGLFSTLKGARSGGHAAHLREAHVGSDEQAAHAILAQAGPNAAILLVCCKDQETQRTVTARAADRASYIWNGSRTEFLADLDPAASTTGYAPLSASTPTRTAQHQPGRSSQHEGARRPCPAWVYRPSLVSFRRCGCRVRKQPRHNA